MLVDEPGRSVIVLVDIIVCGGQKRFKITDKIKRKTELFFFGLEILGYNHKDLDI